MLAELPEEATIVTLTSRDNFDKHYRDHVRTPPFNVCPQIGTYQDQMPSEKGF